MKTSITFYPNLSKKSKKTGKVPLYARVCSKGQKAEERLNAEVSENDLLKWNPMSMRFSDRELLANKLLNTFDKRFEEFIIMNAASLSKNHPRKILDYVLGKEDNKVEINLLQYLNSYLEKSVLQNPELSSGTVRNYKKSVNHFKSFLQESGKEKLVVSEASNLLAIGFKDYLQRTDLAKGRKGMSEVSASSIVKNLKPIFNRAIDEGHLQQNPMKVLKLRHKSPKRDRLTIGQVRALYNLDVKNIPPLQAYKDIFLFSVFTGLAYMDAISLKPSHLEWRKEELIKLTIRRGKTDIQTESFLVTQAVQIVDRYKDVAENKITGLVLPKRSNEKLNLNLKSLAALAGIPINLSSHIARHTHRQLLAEAGIEDIGVIKRMMGHSGSGDIDSVYYSVTESRLLEAKGRFEAYLNKHLQ